MEQLLDPEQAASLFRLKPKTLANYRSRGVGPKYVLVGGVVRYRPSDLEAWLEGQTRQPRSIPCNAL